MPAMTVERATTLIESMAYKPGWRFTVEDFTHRFQDTVLVKVIMPARNWNAAEAPDYPTEVDSPAAFHLPVGDCDCDEAVLYRLAELLLRFESHEMREALRVPDGLGNWHAPFHPHRLDAMHAWAARTGAADIAGDLTFGVI